MITDAETNFVYFSDLLPKCFPPLFDKLAGLLKDAGVGVDLIPGTKDIWCRDYMPIQVSKDRFVQFKYWPDYLTEKHQHTITPSEVILAAVPGGTTCQQSEIVLDGGNVVRRSDKVLMTDRVLEGLEGRARGDRVEELRELLEVDQVVIIPQEEDEVYGHADGIVRFWKEETVLVNEYEEPYSDYRPILLAALEDAGLRPAPIPYKPEDDDSYQQSAVGVYINFLRTRNIIIVPFFGLPEDALVMRLFQDLFPDTPVKPVYCRGLAEEGGVLNCVSWSVVL